MTDSEIKHRILGVLLKIPNRQSVNTDIILDELNLPVSLSKINMLCREIIEDDVVRNCTASDNLGTVCIGIKGITIGAYNNEKYLIQSDSNPIQPTFIDNSINLKDSLYVGGDNSGTIGQSRFDNLRNTKIKQTANPKAYDNKQNAIISWLQKFWWQILVPFIIALIILGIDKGWFG